MAQGTLQHSVLQSARASPQPEPNPSKSPFEGSAPEEPIRLGLGREAPASTCRATYMSCAGIESNRLVGR